MANGLTGDFDALVEVSVETVNRILATMHQNKASEEASPTFPHSFAVRVGDVSTFLELAHWAIGVLPAPDKTNPKKTLPASSKVMPPGASQATTDAQGRLTAELAKLTRPAIVRGTARVQVSTPTITLPQGSTSEVNARVQVRAHYTPDPGTLVLPDPVHGEVRATFSVHPKALVRYFGKPMLEVAPTADDSRIQFVPAPGSGMSAADAETIAQQVRLALRTKMEPMNVELPEGFKLARFKGLGSGPNQVIALPVTLSDPEPPASALASVTNLFLAPGDHFGVAISKEHVESLLKPMIDKLKQLHKTYTLTISVPVWYGLFFLMEDISVSYELSVTSVTLTWQTGTIKLTVKAKAIGTDPLPDFTDITIQPTLTLVLNPTTQKVSLQVVGGVPITGLPPEVAGTATNAINAQMTTALTQANDAVDNVLAGVTVDEAVKSFEGSAAAKFTSLEIHPQGVILRGTLTVKPRPPAVVHFTETADGTAFTAFKSWVPAGTVKRYVWTWQRENPYFDVPHHHLEGTNLIEVVADEHGFVLPMPENVPPDGRLCLQVEGTQFPSGGGAAHPVWGESCQIIWPTLRAVLPAAWPYVMAAPVWQMGRARDLSLENAIVAHVAAVAHSEASTELGRNAIVHFADPRSAKPLELLGRALSRRSRRDIPVAVVLVLPRGSFRDPRASFAERLGSLGREFSGSIVITEDYESGWTRTFGVERPPATFVINARGEVVWQHSGRPAAEAVTAALDEHVTIGTRSRGRSVRLAVRPGDRAPDVLFTDARGDRLALRKLRGRRVLLNFWKSWSRPCLAELDRLQHVHDALRTELLILAINDGEDPQRVAEIAREHRLTFMVVPDPDRQIARSYRVNCWPTTIAVDEEGHVERVHFGVTSDHSGRIA